MNNNSNTTERGKNSLPQSDESNSCDCKGMSAIKLDDSEDGSNQEVPSTSTAAVNDTSHPPSVVNDKSLWSADSKESVSKRIPGNFPPFKLEMYCVVRVSFSSLSYYVRSFIQILSKFKEIDQELAPLKRRYSRHFQN